MTPAELRLLAGTHVTVDVETAGRAYGMGRGKAYDLARRGQFPVEVLKLGHRYRVRTALIVQDLLGDQPQQEVGPGGATGTDETLTSQAAGEVITHGKR